MDMMPPCTLSNAIYQGVRMHDETTLDSLQTIRKQSDFYFINSNKKTISESTRK